MKHIKVDCCRNCPLRAGNYSNGYCTHSGAEGFLIYFMETIPDWCPLKDCEEKP